MGISPACWEPPRRQNILDNVWFTEATPLCLVATHDRVAVVKYFIECECEVDKDKYGDTSLHVACVRGSLEIVRIIFDSGVDIEIKDSVDEETPLLMATSSGKTDVMKFLLERGADMNAKTQARRDTLGHAKEHRPGKDPQAVKLLAVWAERQRIKFGHPPNRSQTTR